MLLIILNYSFIFLLGLIMGSFFNSWIWRHYENIRVVMDRSMCIHCRRDLKWWENIPVLSFCFLKGKCRTCSKKIYWRYPLVEIGTALTLTLVYFYHNNYLAFDPFLFFRDVLFVSFLIIIFVYDALYKIIVPGMVWLGVLIGLFFNLFYFGYSWQDLFLGALIAGGFFLLQFLVSRGKWIGGGDVRMGVMMGVWLGWQNTIIALFFAYIVGAIFGVFCLAFKKKSFGAEIPFGTFLALGTFFAMYHGNEVINWYLQLINF